MPKPVSGSLKLVVLALAVFNRAVFCSGVGKCSDNGK